MEDVIATCQGDSNTQARFYLFFISFYFLVGGMFCGENGEVEACFFVISSSASNLNRLAGCSRKTVLKICVCHEAPPPCSA